MPFPPKALVFAVFPHLRFLPELMIVPMSPHTMASSVEAVTKLEWDKALKAQQSRLRKRRYAGLLRLLNYDSFLATLTEEDRRYRQRHIVDYMDFLAPTFKHLDAFTRAFTTLSAASPEITGTLWGGIQVLMIVSVAIIRGPIALFSKQSGRFGTNKRNQPSWRDQMASKFTRIMDCIAAMIKELTEHLTRLHQYLELFPGQEVFQTCLECIVQHYVSFCISAIKFFRRYPICM